MADIGKLDLTIDSTGLDSLHEKMSAIADKLVEVRNLIDDIADTDWGVIVKMAGG